MDGRSGTREANWFAVGAAVVIVVSFTPAAWLLGVLVAAFVLVALWQVALADLWFDHVSLPRLINKPMQARLITDDEDDDVDEDDPDAEIPMSVTGREGVVSPRGTDALGWGARA